MTDSELERFARRLESAYNSSPSRDTCGAWRDVASEALSFLESDLREKVRGEILDGIAQEFPHPVHDAFDNAWLEAEKGV